MSKDPSTFVISKRTGVLAGLLVLALLMLNAALIVQNKKLRASLATNKSPILEEGVLVPSLSGVDVDGKEFTLDFGADPRKVLIFVFSPRCGYCTQNMPNWSVIAKRLDRRSFRIVAVSTLSEGVREYIGKHGLTDVQVISEVDPKTRVSYEMNVTPQTILVDPHGRV